MKYSDAYDKFGSVRRAARGMGIPKSTFFDNWVNERKEPYRSADWSPRLHEDMDKIEKRGHFKPLKFDTTVVSQEKSKVQTKSARSNRFLDPDEMRVALIDLETTGLKSDFAVILCAVIKTYGSRESSKVFSIDLSEPDLLASEKELVQNINYELEEYDGVITYYGNRFDIPFLRTRSFWHGIKPMGKKKSLDMYFTVRRTINPSSRRMDRINQILQVSDPNISEKTKLGILEWNKVLLSRDQHSLDYIITHCIADIEVLENIVYRFIDFVPDRIMRT